VADAGTLTFAPGVTSLSISVIANGDATVEPDETVDVVLSNASDGTITDDTGVGTIVNDDDVVISIADASIVEGDSGATNLVFNVSLDQASFDLVSVDFDTTDISANVGSDFAVTAGTLTIAPGATTGTITVPVNGDTTIEADETFFVELSNPTNTSIADSQGLGTILNDDEAVLHIGWYGDNSGW